MQNSVPKGKARNEPQTLAAKTGLMCHSDSTGFKERSFLHCPCTSPAGTAMSEILSPTLEGQPVSEEGAPAALEVFVLASGLCLC